jgi:uncharacterized membrane protein YphA (DoxX/SURF4 family)
MKTRTTNHQALRAAYFGTLSVFSLAMASSGWMDLAQPQPFLEGMHHLGYPTYFVSVIGFWKLLGVSAVLAPRLPRLKEWAYAGFTFELSGAAVSHVMSGDGVGKALIPLALLLLGLASWYLRPVSRRLGSAATTELHFDDGSQSSARLAPIRTSDG